MLARETYDFKQAMTQQGAFFCYSGYVTEPILSGIGQALKRKLELEETDTKKVRNVFAIFVEQMQNIIRYSAEREPTGDNGDDSNLRYGVVLIGVDSGEFWVTCGNLVERRDVERLRSRLGELQTSDKDKLKALYKEKLRGETEATSKGAGIGFIEIARRSTKIIDFDFLDVDDEHAFFCLKSSI
ncbi:MAG: hypothetical protein CMM50_17005 [Rhodospirillaceae bacterium]|nr:hypothetical protein [Rhodospirillaceae bacterium]|tara:strand:- start:615 stop:1169 length:555 start_codon:yes stop_codon:yes gene_type:complete